MGVFTQSTQFVQNVRIQDLADVDLVFTTGTYRKLDTLINVTDVLSCSRASTGYAQNSDGTLTSFGTNTLRITDIGLLVEDARTNLVLQSQDFSAGVWGAGAGVTVNVNATTAPDGTLTADKLTATASDSFIAQNFTISNGANYVYSVWLRADTPTTLSIKNVNNSPGLLSCDVTTVWQRFILSGTATFSTTTLQIGGNSSFTTGEIVYAWGAQLEQASFASSYIPTTTTSATRAADAVDCAGTLNTVLLATAAQSMFVDWLDIPGAATIGRLIASGSGNAAAALDHGSSTSVLTYNNSDPQQGANFAYGSTYTGAKACYAQNASGRSLVGNSGTVYTDGLSIGFGSSPAYISPIALGREAGGGAHNGFTYFRRLRAWSSRLSDARLQALTAP